MSVKQEFIDKWLGATLVKINNKKQHEGKTVVAILMNEDDGNCLSQGNLPELYNFWLLVEDENQEQGYFATGSYDDWFKFPEERDYSKARLDHIKASFIEELDTPIILRKDSSTYAAGPEGQTKGYLDGNTGLEFL